MTSETNRLFSGIVIFSLVLSAASSNNTNETSSSANSILSDSASYTVTSLARTSTLSVTRTTASASLHLGTSYTDSVDGSTSFSPRGAINTTLLSDPTRTGLDQSTGHVDPTSSQAFQVSSSTSMVGTSDTFQVLSSSSTLAHLSPTIDTPTGIIQSTSPTSSMLMKLVSNTTTTTSLLRSLSEDRTSASLASSSSFRSLEYVATTHLPEARNSILTVSSIKGASPVAPILSSFPSTIVFPSRTSAMQSISVPSRSAISMSQSSESSGTHSGIFNTVQPPGQSPGETESGSLQMSSLFNSPSSTILSSPSTSAAGQRISTSQFSSVHSSPAPSFQTTTDLELATLTTHRFSSVFSERSSTEAGLQDSTRKDEHSSTVFSNMLSDSVTSLRSLMRFSAGSSLSSNLESSYTSFSMASYPDSSSYLRTNSLFHSSPRLETTLVSETMHSVTDVRPSSNGPTITLISRTEPIDSLRESLSSTSMTVGNITVTSQFMSSVNEISKGFPGNSLSESLSTTGFSQISSTQPVTSFSFSGFGYSSTAESDSPRISSNPPASSTTSSINDSVSVHPASPCIQCIAQTTLYTGRYNQSYVARTSVSTLGTQGQITSISFWNPSLSQSGVSIRPVQSFSVSSSIPSPLSTLGEQSSIKTFNPSATLIMSTSAMPPLPPYSGDQKNLILLFSFKGDCDFILNNKYVFRKFWRSLLRLTEKASNMTSMQHDVSFVDAKCVPFQAVVNISVMGNISVVNNINNYFNSNASHSKIFVRLNNGSDIPIRITHYEFLSTYASGQNAKTKSPLSEIVVISTAATICAILVTAGVIIFIREYRAKRKSERFRFHSSGLGDAKGECVALRNLSRTVHGSSLEMQDNGSLSGAYNSPFDADYSTISSQKGRKTDFMTQADMNGSTRSKTKYGSLSKKKGRRQAPVSGTGSGTSSQSTQGYGLVIGLLGYKTNAKDPIDTYAVPNKKGKVQGLSIRNMGDNVNEMPTLPLDKSKRTEGVSKGSPVPPPRNLRNLPKHSEATDSIEKLMPSSSKDEDAKPEGIINPVYTDDDDRGVGTGSTASVHI